MGKMRGLYLRLRASLLASIGDITFGMEDGAVSVAGLVFGVSASTNDASIVVLAGATGAAAGAVSMMAGRYLDVQSVGHRAEALLASNQARIAKNPTPYLDRAGQRLEAAGFTSEESAVVAGAFKRNPQALLDHVAAYELGLAVRPEASPTTHALWMFISDLAAASIPVIPFVLFDIETARIVSLVVTGILMAILGMARGRIGGVNIWLTAGQTMAIAGTAALAGVVIGRLVTTQ